MTSTTMRAARLTVAALVAGVATGIAWWLFNLFSYGYLFALIFGLAIGWVISEAVELATNRRRGPPLQIIGVAGCVLAYAARLSLVIVVDQRSLSELRLLELFPLIAMGIAGWIAAQRLR
jgi:hypothetical protein